MPAMTPRVTPSQPATDMCMSNKNRESSMMGTLLKPPINDKVEPFVSVMVQKAEAHTAVVKKPEAT